MYTTAIDTANILLVDDNIISSIVLKKLLKAQGYNVYYAEDGYTALNLFQTKNIDLCLLDITMPEMDGFTLGKIIRAANAQIPILYLTGNLDESYRLSGFHSGGDDFITKPTSIEELTLRINVFLRRSRKLNELSGPLYPIGDYTLNEGQHTLTKNGIIVSLAPNELKILLLLIKNKSRIVKRSYILNEVWGNDNFYTGRNLDVYISKLRKRLKDDPHVEIETVKNEGYGLKVYTGI